MSENSHIRWHSESRSAGRVCDPCIRKKTKCMQDYKKTRNLKQPTCGTCAQAGSQCSYSYRRKRPGPPKGYQRKQLQLPTASLPASGKDKTTTDTTNGDEEGDEDAVDFGWLPSPICQTIANQTSLHESNSSADPVPTTQYDTSCFAHPYYSSYSPEYRIELATNFAQTVNICFPLFREADFITQLTGGLMSTSLISAIYTISSRVASLPSPHGEAELSTQLIDGRQRITLEQASILEEGVLDEWRLACLLCWYGFHQYPGRMEELHLAVLIRKAYQIGLNHIDDADNCDHSEWHLVPNETLEAWRRVWWCIYILDSYSSFANATPSLIETRTIQTSLFGCRSGAKTSGIVIPSDPMQLWRVVADISSSCNATTFAFHMLINTLLKEVVTECRILRQQGQIGSTFEHLSMLQDALAAVQLALPTNYTRLNRNLLDGESDREHNSRLQTLLKLHAIRLLLSLPYGVPVSSQWIEQWQENLDHCYQMVEIIQRWNADSFLAVDPAVAFIAFPLLYFLHLHIHSSTAPRVALLEQLRRRKEVVRLFLARYARHWDLVQVLLECHDSFVAKIATPLSQEDVVRLIKQFEGPLHRKWLKFLFPNPEMDPLSVRRTLRPDTLSFTNLIEMGIDIN